MKKILAYLLLLSLLVISVSACGSKEADPSSTAAPASSLTVIQLTADPGAANVTLDWQMVKSAETYNLYYLADTGIKPDAASMKLGSKITGVLTAPYVIESLNNGTKYWFAFSYSSSVLVESDLSPVVSATPSVTPPPPPPSPKNIRANAGDAKVTISWDPSPGADSYNVYTYLFTDGTTFNLYETYTGVTSPLVLTPLINERPYFFWVTAVGASSGESGTSFYVYATPSTSPPPWAPDNLNASVPAGVDNEVTLIWTDVAGATSYNVYAGTAKGVTITNGQQILGFVNGANVAGLAGGVKYYFIVTAVGANGKESAESNEVSATPTGT